MLMPTINTVLLHYVDVVVVFVIFFADGSMLISDIGMRRDDKTIRFISIKDTSYIYLFIYIKERVKCGLSADDMKTI